MKISSVYDDGSILPDEILNLDPSTLLTKFELGVRNITALSLGAGYPIEATIPIILGNAFRNVAAFSLESGYEFYNLDSKSKKLILQLALLLPRLKQNLRLKRKNLKKKKRKRLLLPLLKNRNKTWIWEICLADRI